MATNAPSIDKTEGKQGVKFTALVGSGGVTAGYAVKWDGSNNRTVVLCSADTDEALGIARDTVSATGIVNVLGDGCLVKVPATITVGAKVEPADTTGLPRTYTDGVVMATCETAATLASVIRISCQLL